MASSIGTDKFSPSNKVTAYRTTSAGSATDVAWVDMRDYEGILVVAVAASLAGDGITAFKILGNSESDGSGTDREVKAHAVGSAPDAVGDYLVLEATQEDFKDVNADIRYASANITCDNASDIIATTYIRFGARYKYDGLTADYVS